MTKAPIIHAGCMALWSRSGWRAAIIEGEAGVGKSDLALRLIDAGFVLVSDDRTLLWRSGDRLFGKSPSAIAGLIEARGLGLLEERHLDMSEVVLSVRCEPPRDRLPDPETVNLFGAQIPLLRLDPLQASAPAKLRRALTSLGAGPQGAYLAAAAPPHPGPAHGGSL